MKKLCLGIESTAHTFSAGIVDFGGKVYSLINDIFIPEEGGLHPALVREQHLNNFMNIINKALSEAEISIDKINLIAFSQSPGLGPVLKIGALVARILSQMLKIPIVGVNHCIAHIEIGKLVSHAREPVALYVSGGNTIVAAFERNRYRVFGETLDIAVGNCLDVFARNIGLKPERGKALGEMVEELAAHGISYITLPYVVKGMDLSFSGLLTAAINIFHENKHNVEDLCFSFQETVFSMLTEVTERALAHSEKKEVLLIGGVAANKRLQSMFEMMAKGRRGH